MNSNVAGPLVGERSLALVFTLDGVVPRRRSFDEYMRMFALSERDLELKILGCGDGPASFNAEASRRGWRVVSCDPIHQWSASDIRGRVAETYEQIIEQTRQNADEFVWTSIPSVEELGRRGWRRWKPFWTTTRPGRPRRDTSTAHCRCCRSRMTRLSSAGAGRRAVAVCRCGCRRRSCRGGRSGHRSRSVRVSAGREPDDEDSSDEGSREVLECLSSRS